MSFSIENARPDDLATLETLENATLRPPWNRQGIEDALADAKYLVLIARDEAGETAGFLIAYSAGDEAEIARLGVLPAFRRRGLAQTLLQHARREFSKRGVRRIFLELRAGNEAALRLYETLGFVQTGRRQAYYPDGEDAVLMSAR